MGILDLVLTLLLAGHLVCMNLAAGLPLFCVLLQWQTRARDAQDATDFIRRFGHWAIAAVLVGSLTGLLVGCLMWVVAGPALMEVLPRFERKIWWGLTELVFYVLCLGIYLRMLRSPAEHGADPVVDRNPAGRRCRNEPAVPFPAVVQRDGDGVPRSRVGK